MQVAISEKMFWTYTNRNHFLLVLLEEEIIARGEHTTVMLSFSLGTLALHFVISSCEKLVYIGGGDIITKVCMFTYPTTTGWE